MTPDIQIGDKVKITDTRFALPVSPFYLAYQELWHKYGNRIGRVTGFTNESSQYIKDTQACQIEFDDGDSVAWELHLLTKVTE